MRTSHHNLTITPNTLNDPHEDEDFLNENGCMETLPRVWSKLKNLRSVRLGIHIGFDVGYLKGRAVDFPLLQHLWFFVNLTEDW